MAEYWIGLMSGTSMDGIDAVLVSFDNNRINLHQQKTHPYTTSLRQKLLRLTQNSGTPDELGEVDHQLGIAFAEAADALIRDAGASPQDVRAIGSHGQTIRHQPCGQSRFTMQLGDPNLIVERTGVQTVSDFRRRDMAAGGQGAPLVPAFHQAWFGQTGEDRCIVNIGGITNITWLPGAPEAQVTGFDTGPGNALLDAWCYDQSGRQMDYDGQWASQGRVQADLLKDFLSDAYFYQAPPKSTGKERFNIEWLKTYLARHPNVPPVDIQRTLLELTVITLINQLPVKNPGRLIICGGGAHNPILMKRLREELPETRVETTDTLGLSADWVEAVAFAWLAKRTLDRKPGNMPSVTGAKEPRVLGAVWPA